MRIGSALAFLGTRMAKRTVNTVERKIVWSGIGAVLGTIAVVFFFDRRLRVSHPRSGAGLGRWFARVGLCSAGRPGVLCANYFGLAREAVR